jgi:hypothetical protein
MICVVSWKSFEQVRTRRLRFKGRLELTRETRTPPPQRMADRSAPPSRLTSQRSRGDGSLIEPYSHRSANGPLCGTPVRRGERRQGRALCSFPTQVESCIVQDEQGLQAAPWEQVQPAGKLLEFRVKDKPRPRPHSTSISRRGTPEAHQSAPRVRSCSLRGQ